MTTRPLDEKTMREDDRVALQRIRERLAAAGHDAGFWAGNYHQDVAFLLSIAQPRPRKGSFGAEVVPAPSEHTFPCWNHVRPKFTVARYEAKVWMPSGPRAAYIRLWSRYLCEQCARAFAARHGIDVPPEGSSRADCEEK
jgi:hypothetical protein